MLFVDGSLDFVEPANFVGVGVRNNGVIWLEESLAGTREKILRVEV